MSFGSAPNLFAWLWQAFLRPHDGTQPSAANASDEESPLLPELRLAREGFAMQAGRDAGAARADRALGRIEARLMRPPRVALMGDFNSGKSSLAHLLMGGAMPPGGVIPETRAPVLFRYAKKPELFLVGSDGSRRSVAAGTIAPSLNGAAIRYAEAGLPLDLLRRVEIVDIPGTANPNTEIEAHAFLPEIVRSVHFALWCTPAPQAWKGNEQRAWFAMPKRLKTASILVATQADRLRAAGDREKVLNRLRREAGAHFRSVVMISARQRALTIDLSAAERERAKAEGANMDLWYAYGGAALWQALDEAIIAVRTAREASAARAAERIAKRKMGASKPVVVPIPAAPIQAVPISAVPISVVPIPVVPIPVAIAEPAPTPTPTLTPTLAPVPTPAPMATPASQAQPRPPVQEPAPQPRPEAQEQRPPQHRQQTEPPPQRQPQPVPVQPQLQPLQTKADLRDALLELWSRRAEAISVRLNQVSAPSEALFTEFANELDRFAHEVLMPRLEQHFSRAQADDIAVLFLCDVAMLKGAAMNVAADARANLLIGILSQLTEELSEALAAGATRQAAAIRTGAATGEMTVPL